jgi:glycosyltransferase involved in cell wall biosynthesis
MSIAIFVPVYNDEETLAEVLNKVPKMVGRHNVELFIVDDGSGDKSYEIALRFTSNVIRHDKNRGVGAATKTGLVEISKYPDFDYILKFDADGQHNPAMIPTVVSRLKKEADVVICSRFHERSDVSYAFIDRLLLNASAASWVNQITDWGITDARSGFMGFRSDLIREIANDIITDRYGIPIELLLRIYNLNPDVSVCEIPHPAVYGGDISSKLETKYIKERIADKVNRMEVAYTAFLNVLESLGLNLNEHRKMSITA